MKVRIVKAKPTAWYAGQIGCTLNVENHSDGINYSACFIGQRMTFFILAEDCEILPEENQPEPFDLERALRGDNVVTRDGRAVTEVTHFKTAEKTVFCVGGVCDGEVAYWDIEGHFTPIYGKASRDLFMAPRESEYVTKWVNLYAAGCATWENSEQEAIAYNEKTGYKGYIGTFPITFKLPK